VLSVPTVVAGENYSMETAEPTEGATVFFVFEGQPLWVSLFIHT